MDIADGRISQTELGKGLSVNADSEKLQYN